MQLKNNISDFESLPQPVVSSETLSPRKPKSTQPQLSMVWVQEADGNGGQRLVARWVTQD